MSFLVVKLYFPLHVLISKATDLLEMPYGAEYHSFIYKGCSNNLKKFSDNNDQVQ